MAAYDFGQILQTLRTERGFTQKQLADLLHIECSSICKYEKNLQCPTFDTVRTIAAVFNVSMDSLLGTEKNTAISTVGLSTEQIQILRTLADEFRNKQATYPKKLNDSQYQIIGKIAVELLK